ncbi:MAG: helix-turn-helix domain-containing protein [Planctomycetota bacterium]
MNDEQSTPPPAKQMTPQAPDWLRAVTSAPSTTATPGPASALPPAPSTTTAPATAAQAPQAAPQDPAARPDVHGPPLEGQAMPVDLRSARPDIAALPANVLAVDVPTAAEMLGVCAATIRREIDRGQLRAVRIGRVYRVRVAELHAYLKRLESA